MATALSVYGTTAASSTLSTADLLVSTTGGLSDSRNTLVGRKTGWGEIWSQGNTAAWAGGSSEPTTPSGHGWLFDVTTLEGQQIIAGNWNASIRLLTSAGSITCVAHLKAWVRSSGGVYTAIIDLAALSQTIGTPGSSITFQQGTTSSATNFNTGDKLYVELPLDITANSTGSNSANVINQASSSSTAGVIGWVEVDTPGYQAQSGGGAVHRLICDGYGGVFS